MTLLSRIALRLTSFAETWLPDAFIFALLATGLAVVGGLTIGGAGLGKVVQAWGDGVWGLIPFTLQMALVIITGTVVATAPHRWPGPSTGWQDCRAVTGVPWSSSR